MTELDLPDPGQGRSWVVSFDDGDLTITLVNGTDFDGDLVEIQKSWIPRRSGQNQSIPYALRVEAQKILADDELRAFTGSYTYKNGKLVKE